MRLLANQLEKKKFVESIQKENSVIWRIYTPIFFKKEDEKLLKSLLAKVRAQAEQHDVHSAKGVLAAEKSALDEIVGSKLSSTQKDALIEWKHTHF